MRVKVFQLDACLFKIATAAPKLHIVLTVGTCAVVTIMD